MYSRNNLKWLKPDEYLSTLKTEFKIAKKTLLRCRLASNSKLLADKSVPTSQVPT